MEIWDKVDLVQRLQDYLVQHAEDEGLNMNDFYRLSGYSRRHTDRLFKELLNWTPQEYLRRIRMTGSAKRLVDEDKTILEIALETSFDTHEGYVRAFSSLFGVTPSQYKKGKTPIPLLIPYPVKSYYEHLLRKERKPMDAKTCLCMITPVQRPKRKFMYLRSRSARDYWSYCQEVGCDWEGLLGSIPSRLDTAAILTLPLFLQKPGFSLIASGIEVPEEYDGTVPAGWEIAKLKPCVMLQFQSQPYQTEEDFFFYMEELLKAAATFNPAPYGYRAADELAPKFNYGGQPETGARLAVPVCPAR